MSVEILTFLTDHKLIIIGAATTFCEVVVVFVNMRRKLRKDLQTVSTMDAGDQRAERRTRVGRMTSKEYLLWSANPINLFRKP